MGYEFSYWDRGRLEASKSTPRTQLVSRSIERTVRYFTGPEAEGEKRV